MSAYANYDGGSVIFGVDDQGTVVGLADPESACLDIENKINDSISPQPCFELKVNKREKTIELSVSAGLNKPYLYRGKAYRRNDTATIPVDPLELSRLVLQGKNINFESLPASNQELTFGVLADKAKDEIGIHDLSMDVLRSLGLYSKDDGYNHAAELLSDKNDFPGIDMACFGDSISIIKRFFRLSVEKIISTTLY